MRSLSSPSWFERHRRPLAAFTLAAFTLTSAMPALAGGYVDGSVALNPATSINIGGISLTPTFNNDQFNDKVLVGTVNNDPVRTPSTADPVSTVSGNNYHDETDFMIRGRNGLNIVFTRTFNSEPSATKLDRGLGYGWSHSYLMRLKSNDFGDCPNCTSTQKPENANSLTSSITYTDERGGEQNYLVNETTFAVTSPKGVYDTLALDSPAVGQHTLTFRNGVKYIFETPTGNLKTAPNIVSRLKYIDNPWGDRLTLAYDVNGRLSTLTDNLGISGRTGLLFTYDVNGRLKDVTDWTARKWIYAYDASGNLTGKTNPLNEILSYTYPTGTHLLNEIRLPLQRDGLTVKTAFKYYQNGRTFNYANALGNTETLDYDLYRKSTRVTDPRGGIREYFYDDNGRMTKLTEPDGAVLLFENQNDAIRSKKYDALGYATTYSYRNDRAFTGASDVFGQVTREQDALGRTVDYTYGPLDQIASVKDKRGTLSTTTFSSAISGCDYTNRPKETRIALLSGAANVLLSSQCWNPDGTLNYARQYLDASRYGEMRLTYQAGSSGLNVSQEQIVGMPSSITITKTYTYDSLGRKKTETLKRRTSPTNAALIDLTSSVDYDALDRVIKATDALGNEVINNYDANGQLWKVTHRYKKPDATFDVRDIVTRTFDAADRVKTETDAEGNVTTYTYDEAGNVIAVTDAEGHTARIEYDAMNRKTAVIDATGYRTETTLTLRGDVVGIKNANNETVKFEIDALGRKTAAIDAKGYRSEFTFDENGNLTCAIDANAQASLQPKNAFGCSESRQYDELNRVTKIVDALNGETSFTYDLAGNRLTIKDPENKTSSFAYDDLGRLKSETDHQALSTAYKTDEAGNLYEKTNRLAEVTRVSFDNANRPTRVDYLKDGSAETFGYDAAGNRNAAANGNVSYSFLYDRLNRLTSKTDSRGKSLSFSFDKVGNILTKTTYQGSTTSYLYNAANRLVQLRNPDYLQVDYQYDPAGRLLSRVTSAGARTTSQFDANGWQSRLSQYDAANVPISDTSYTRDRAGNILTSVDGSGTTTYAYDPLYRLKTADYPGAANDEAFDYDKVGNRKQYTKGSLTPTAGTRYYNYAAGTNRISEIRVGSAVGAIESTFAHDLEGRLTAQAGVGAKTLTWDAKSRVKTVGGETYSYDAMDYRIGRSGGALGNLAYFLEGEHLESVYSGSTLQAKYFRGASVDELVAGYLYDTDSKLKPYLFHHDNVNSVSQISGHNGGTIQSTAFSVFGNTQSTTGTSPNRLKYTGREDDGTGLYYYRARYYDPQVGRFVSEDPLGFDAGINFYAYVGNNPINGNDPMGLEAFVYASPRQGGGFNYRAFDDNGSKVLAGTFNANTFVNTNVLRAGDYTISPRPYIDKTVGQALWDLATFNNRNAHAFRPTISNTNDWNLIQYSDGATLRGVQVHPGRTAEGGGISLGCLVCSDVEYGRLNSLFNTNYSDGGVNLRVLPGSMEDAFPSFKIAPNVPTYDGSGQGSTIPSLKLDWDLGSAAGGGFLLYPNKANTNMMQSVYSK